MSEEARREAERLGLDNNQSALLKAAAEPREHQAGKLREIASPVPPSIDRQALIGLRGQLNGALRTAHDCGLFDVADAIKAARAMLDETGKRIFAAA